MTELPEGIAKGVHKAADGIMTDWTEEQILDEIIELTEYVEGYISDGDEADKAFALSNTAERLGRLYQEVGKKLLWRDGE